VPVLISKDDLRRVLLINADTLSRVFDDFAKLVVDSLNLSLSPSSSNPRIHRVSSVNGFPLLVFNFLRTNRGK